MSVDKNKAIVRRYLDEVWNQARFEVADELVSPNYAIGNVGSGPEGSRANVRAFRTAFPDLNITIEDLVAEGDKVVARMRLSGTHHGPFREYAPTGRHATWEEVGIWTVRDGHLQAGWFLADMYGLRQQLGVLPIL